jgi:hypothetical protein
VDQAIGEPVRRYEHPCPGSLIHVDGKKLANIPTAASRGSSAASKEAGTRPTPPASRGGEHHDLVDAD